MISAQKIKLIVFFACLFCLRQNSFSQTNTDTLMVLIGDVSNSPKHINYIKSTIKQISGIRLVGYCENHSIYVLCVNKNIYQTNGDVYNMLVSTTGSTKLLLKEGEISEIISFCNFQSDDESEKVKNKLRN